MKRSSICNALFIGMGKVHISALGFRFLGFEILLGSGLGLMTFGSGQAWVNEVQDKLRSSFFPFFS